MLFAGMFVCTFQPGNFTGVVFSAVQSAVKGLNTGYWPTLNRT